MQEEYGQKAKKEKDLHSILIKKKNNIINYSKAK